MTIAEDAGLSPAGCLALLWPLLPEALVPPAIRETLERTAADLPPVPAVALEFRLVDDPTIDLHQLIEAEQRHLLPAYVAGRTATSPGEASLVAVLSDWMEDARGIPKLFLEWDRPGDGEATAPGVFLALDPPGATGDAARRKRIVALAERLSPGGWGIAAAAIDRVRQVLPTGASINFLGFMLGRDDALRVNIRHIRPDDFVTFLAAVGWPGDAVAASRHFEMLVRSCDRVTIALDFAPELQPTLGLEVFMESGPASEPRFARLFDHFEALGVCAPERRAALALLDARLLPEADGQDWPAAWAMAAAVRSDRDLPWLRVRLSHLKLSFDRHGTPSAKAYVAVRHFWSRGEAQARAPVPRSRHQARTAALEFLLERQGQDDLWRDFAIANGASDHWVTALVGFVLANQPDPRARDAADRARRALLRGRRGGGWGYNAASPPDADSTAWAIRFIRALDPADPAIVVAEAFLAAHFLPDGGLTTYAPTTAIRFVGNAVSRDDSGWRGRHDCVAANAASALTGAARARLLASLRGAQAADGSWRAYWWRHDVYSTALAIEALAAVEADGLGRALAWMRAQRPDNAFDLAWQMLALRHGGPADRDAASDLADRLAADQLADGSWSAGADMLFPDPATPHRAPEATCYPDLRRTYTTASALLALEAWR
ncbi:MAG: hypothetical protein ACTHJR_14095 [Sphingomonas sp.]|uniref:hypothetical protein n=1 Tax=Sphingomonas sp. TaxID=28214 RepID=UPI003F7FE961